MKTLYLLFAPILAQSLFGVDISQDNNLSKVDPASLLSILSFTKILWTIFFFIIAYLFISFFTKALTFFAEKSSQLRISLKGLIPIIRIFLWIVFIFIVIKEIYHPPKEMIIGALASVAIAVGFATQDLLKNIFGGMMLLFERPFKVGDKIKVAEHYGEVINVGLRATQIVTPDDTIVHIPNMEIMNSNLSNSNSGELSCQVVAKIILPIDVSIEKARNIAIESAQVSKYIYLNKPIVVLFSNKMNEQKPYLEMKIKAYVMDIRHEFQLQSDLTEIIIKELLAQKMLKNYNNIND